MAAYGTLDELNATLGLLQAHLTDRKLARSIQAIQEDLFVLGAELATAPNHRPPVRLPATRVKALERQIDRFQQEAPTPLLFILPGGTLAAALAHFARTVCRRAERQVVALAEREPVRPTILRYLNRLSDWLFALALVLNRRAGLTETHWRGRRSTLPQKRRTEERTLSP